MAVSLPLAKDLLKTSNILTCSTDTPLSKAAASLNTSHDAVFVIENKDLKGVINPVHSLIKKRSYDSETKVANLMFMPPRLSPDTPFVEIARLMNESKVYYLPVVKGHQFQAIVTINRLFQFLLDNPHLIKALAPATPSRPIITITPDTEVQHAINIMRDHSISHLPVVSGNNRLDGIVTQHDLRYLLVSPVRKSSRFSMTGNKQAHLDEAISGFMNRLPETVPENTDNKTLITRFLNKQIGSVIIIKSTTPIGIITRGDLLASISHL
jgi:CBS domain-containing protein